MHTLATSELVLEPLVVSHAEAMFDVLSDPDLYRYLDYPPPPSIEHLRGVYASVQARMSPNGAQLWLNWIVRLPDQPPIGYVQATVAPNQGAWLGYLFSKEHWGKGYATQATRAVLDHLASAYGVTRFLATVEAQNHRSIRLLERLGFHQAAGAELEGHELSPTERLFIS